MKVNFNYGMLALLWGFTAFASVPPVTTGSGVVLGVEQKGVNAYLGIPFAEPPTGALRWRAPVPHASWSTPFSATREGEICLQPTDLGSTKTRGKEDCLSLNVWVPRVETRKEPLPVMVFIHGGFFVIGTSDQTTSAGIKFHVTNGAGLAKHGSVIIVSMNYRLGPLGFFAHPAVIDGSKGAESGNLGLLDQLAALQWVRDNIAAFGGDPKNVTAFGESAGGSSILSLIASPLSEGLFSRAIVESGYIKDVTVDVARQRADELTTKAGCAGKPAPEQASCLRALTGDQVIAAAPASALVQDEKLFTPYRDGVVIAASGLEDQYAQGKIRPIQVILGTNTDEGANLVGALFGKPITTSAELDKIIGETVRPELSERALKVFDQPALGDPQHRLIQLVTDKLFTCPISAIGRMMSVVPGMDVRRYIFSHHVHFPGLSSEGAAHGFELALVFGTLPPIPGLGLSFSETPLSHRIQDYWTSFAKDGVPSRPKGTAWPEFDASKQSALEFHEPFGANGIHAIEAFRADRCLALGL